jgi:hypothetical protein
MVPRRLHTLGPFVRWHVGLRHYQPPMLKSFQDSDSIHCSGIVGLAAAATNEYCTAFVTYTQLVCLNKYITVWG